MNTGILVSDGYAGRVYEWYGAVTGRQYRLAIDSQGRRINPDGVVLANIALAYWAKGIQDMLSRPSIFGRQDGR